MQGVGQRLFGPGDHSIRPENDAFQLRHHVLQIQRHEQALNFADGGGAQFGIRQRVEIQRMLSPREAENKPTQFLPQHNGIIREVKEGGGNFEGGRGGLREREVGFVVQNGRGHERLRFHALDDACVHELADGIVGEEIIFLQLHLDHAIDDLGITTRGPDGHGVGGNDREAKTIRRLERGRTAAFIQAHALGDAHA